MNSRNILVCTLLFSVLTGCGGGLDRFPVAETKGKVMCNGKPVPFVRVFFEPVAEDRSGTAIVGKAGFAEANENGEFVLTTYSNKDGAVVGKHNVKVVRPSGEEHPRFECDCQLSKLKAATQVTVASGESNEFTIELPKAQRRMRPRLTEEELEEMEDA